MTETKTKISKKIGNASDALFGHLWSARGTAGHENHGQYAVSDDVTGKHIAIVYDGKAHAHLLAAAPALLEACKLFIQYDGENCQTGVVEWATLKDAMVNAIAQAEGQQ